MKHHMLPDQISFVVAIGTLALASFVGAQTVEPNKYMLDEPLSFTGIEEPLGEVDQVRIGLLAPDGPEHPVGQALVRGVTLAVESANANGGLDGVAFELIRRWAEDPWTGGASVVSDLAFVDRVVAIIGGPDGPSTHIAQMVATKAHLPLIAPVSTDPSLTHTRVPWIFRLPPDDAVQARLLAEKIMFDDELESLVVITSTDHDGRIFAAEIATALEVAGRPPVAHLELPVGDFDGHLVAKRLKGFNPDVIFMRTPGSDLREVAATLQGIGVRVPLFLPWIPGLDFKTYPPSYQGPIRSIVPFERPTHCGPHLKFVRAYIQRWGSRPPPEAAYGYDAARLIIEGLQRGQTGRTGLRSFLADHFSEYAGASGSIRWDTGGGNAAAKPVIYSVVRRAVNN